MSRGYAFEKYIVKNLSLDGWQCRRLGGSSMGLPDEIAVNNEHSILYSIEAKSTVGDSMVIPNDQIQRCKKICDMFTRYDCSIVFAFKFSGIKKDRKLKYYFFKLTSNDNIISDIESVRCNYKGILTVNMISNSTTEAEIDKYESIEDLKLCI